MDGFRLFPDAASTAATQVDTLFFALIGLSSFFALLVLCAILYFAIKYRRGAKADRSGNVSGSIPLEAAWTIIPTFMSIGVFVWAASIYFTMERPPANALEVYILGRQWMWEAQHIEGQREINELHVPVNRPIKLLMTSEDVIHSFYVPDFRIKQDVLPGRYTTIWFQATKVGEYRLFCAEYCGTDHAVMGGRIVVESPADYATWLSVGTTGVGAPQTLAASGERLFTSLGCSGCHRMDGSGVAPSLVGVYGKPVPLQDGTTVIADEQYVRDSILQPQKQVVAGYQPIMPTFQGRVSEGQLLQLIAYIQSLSNNQTSR